jgi:cell division protein FtsI/penicillin-binding protein 2
MCPLGTTVYSPATAHAVRDMMEMVVKPGGTAPLAQITGYRVAGKTGTAHKLENGRYVDRYVASFVGMAPASNPRLIVAVMINEPAGKEYYGGQVAARCSAMSPAQRCACSTCRTMRRLTMCCSHRPRLSGRMHELPDT